MATYSRGRSNWGSKGGYSATASAGKHHTSAKRAGTAGTAGVAGMTGTAASPKYKSAQCTFATKINSYKMLYKQTCGPAKYTRPTPATLTTFANWINKGAVVHTCTSAQVARWARGYEMNFNSRTGSPTTCKNVLATKFGKTTIKAVAKTKSGAYMVATSPTWKGKPFCFPK